MQWIVNELSIDGNFESNDNFFELFLPFMRLRSSQKVISENLLCCRKIGDQPVFPGVTFSKAVMNYADKNTRTLILSWINKNGPFWDDDRAQNDDDYFEFNGNDVTDNGLGECARRSILNQDVSTVSLLSAMSVFKADKLTTIHGLPEEPLGTIEISNITDTDTLRENAESVKERPKNWYEAVAHLRDKFDNLAISSDVEDQLQPHPFSSYVLERLEALLGVLQRLINSRDDKGNYTEQTHELLATFFRGEKAWFTDESESNKRDFEEELTFKDPLDEEKTIFCSFHGKIKSPQYRVHFEFPSAKDKVMKVAYIGPKITKK